MSRQTGQTGRKQEQKSIVLLKSKNGGFFFSLSINASKNSGKVSKQKKKKNRNTAIKKRTSWLAKKGNDFK